MSGGENNFVSVLMPAFNSARFLGQAVESVLAQSHRDFELILINDGSTDGTLALAQSYAQRDKRITIITHANMGMGRSLNDAMRWARGDWIARLDADDLMTPKRLERQLAFLRKIPTWRSPARWFSTSTSAAAPSANTPRRLPPARPSRSASPGICPSASIIPPRSSIKR